MNRLFVAAALLLPVVAGAQVTTAKPDCGSLSIDTGATNYPPHLWPLCEGTGTTTADEGSAAADWDFTFAAGGAAPAWDTAEGTHGTVLDFVLANTEYMEATSLDFSAITIVTVAFVLQTSTTNTDMRFGQIAEAGDLDSYVLMHEGADGDQTATADHDAGTLVSNASNLAVDDGAWNMLWFRFDDTSVDLAKNGGNWEADVSSLSGLMAALTCFRVGYECDSSPALPFTGSIAAIALWTSDVCGATSCAAIYNAGDPWALIGITEAAAPAFTVGPTEAAAANGHTISGTITCTGTCTVYAAAWPPAASAPADCDAVQAASGALFAASEVWTTGVGDSFALTEDNNPPRTDVYVCGSDGTTDTAVTSLTDQDRSPDSGKAIVALTSVAATSPFTLQTVAGCDTTDTSSTVTGCTDTSWLDVGMLVDLSAGFADLTDALVTAVTATTITFDRAANATSSNITVTQDQYYSATVVATDVTETTRSSSTGFEAIIAVDGTLTVDEYSDTHDGSNNAAALSDSGESWVTSEHIGATVQNTTDGSSCVITANTATTVTCTLAGGTQNDWDTNDVYVIVPVAQLSDYQVVSYCIEDVSDATDATFTTPNCWTTPDSMYLFDVVPEWGDLGQFPVLLYQDEAMTEIDLATVCTHVNGHTLTFIVDSGTVPNGTTIASDGSWTGTPDTEDENGETLNLRCKNQGGLTVEADISSYVTDDEIVAPQCVGDTVNTCLSDLDAVRGWAESGEQLTATFQCSTEANEDLILSQDPVAMGTLAAEDDPLVVVVGLGACGATNPGNRGSQLRGVQLGL